MSYDSTQRNEVALAARIDLERATRAVTRARATGSSSMLGQLIAESSR